uniref:Uncharacterized protein n=1 Tax=Podoviridae sp. ctsNK10 TaxID=2826582 RepID=A0A8S5NLS1_9CAUD|nr:MAG TPA: hypothetical protein [Podoviridae sp. ctsNK10]
MQLEPTSLSKTSQKTTSCTILKNSLTTILMKYYNLVTL